MRKRRRGSREKVPTLVDVRALAAAQLQRPGMIPGLVFLALGLSIAANALFFQTRHHPSPFFTHAAREMPSHAVARRDEVVRAIQEALARSGRYAGAIDGIAGPQTEAAIRAFEESRGRAPTGKADVALLTEILTVPAEPPTTASVDGAAPPREAAEPDDAIARLASGADPAATHPDAGSPDDPDAQHAAAPPASDPLVAAVQSALADAAYGPITADGVIGPATRAAIMRFQRDHNLPVTGEISESLMVELRATGALHDG